MANTLAIILAVCFVFAGLPMATAQPKSVEQGRHLGFSDRNYRLLGWVQIVGAVTLGLGLLWEPAGVAAAIGFSLMMAGAVITHLRAKDPVGKVFPAILFGLAAAATVVLFLV